MFPVWPACNGADGISDIEGKVTRVGASECGQRASFNRDRDLADEPHWCSSVFGCRNAGGVAIRSTSDDNVNDLFLRVSVLRHATPGRQRGDHLLHRLAV